MSREPLLTAAALVAIVMALINLLRAFGVPVTEEQIDALNELLVYVAPFAVALIARRFVTPLSSARDNTGVPLVRSSDQQRPVV